MYRNYFTKQIFSFLLDRLCKYSVFSIFNKNADGGIPEAAPKPEPEETILI